MTFIHKTFDTLLTFRFPPGVYIATILNFMHVLVVIVEGIAVI